MSTVTFVHTCQALIKDFPYAFKINNVSRSRKHRKPQILYVHVEWTKSRKMMEEKFCIVPSVSQKHGFYPIWGFILVSVGPSQGNSHPTVPPPTKLCGDKHCSTAVCLAIPFSPSLSMRLEAYIIMHIYNTCLVPLNVIMYCSWYM